MNKKYIIAAMATSFALNMNAQSVKVTGNVVEQQQRTSYWSIHQGER